MLLTHNMLALCMADKTTSFKFSRIVGIVLRCVAVLVCLIVLAYVALAWYLSTHKEEVLAKVTAELNANLAGTITVDDMETTFLQGFPRIALELKNVSVTDSLYTKHNKKLLQAEDIGLAINALAFIRGTIQIRHIAISNANVQLYTDASGYSNTSLFRKKKDNDGSGEEGSFPELDKITLDNVVLSIDNQMRGKLYDFKVNSLRGTVKQLSSGWEADVKLDVLVNSMAFSTQKGSFVKERLIKGKLEFTYDKGKGIITCEENPLSIGGEDFSIGGRFWINKPDADFEINIKNKKILWRNAAHLLSPNITRKLDMFNLQKPIAVTCDLKGGFNIEGDPLIYVTAAIKNNVLETPGGTIEDCSFSGIFTNVHVKGKGYNDANSAIKLYNFTGSYSSIPVNMKKAYILDLEKPIAVGDFNSKFTVDKLNNMIDPGLLKFSKGEANVSVNYRADIVDFKLAKPLVNGLITIKNADVHYLPRGLKFNDINVGLDFTRDDLHISRISLKSGKSVLNMDGSIKNFLNLYYTDPAKIVLNWNIYSPQLHLGEFMGFVNRRTSGKSKIKTKKKGDFTNELDLLFEKSNIDMKLRVDKVYYNKFLATNVKADVLLTESGVSFKNAGLNHAGGKLTITGNLSQKNTANMYKLNATVNNVDVKQFFHAFDNFGLEALQARHLKGYLSAKTDISGAINNSGALVPKSMYGNVSFNMKKGALINFEPVRNVGRFAFPFRNMDTITFSNLAGKFDIKGQKVTIQPMKINSSVLNMDIAGVYSFGKGTNINIAVPLRNPKKDKDITDEKELAKRRNRGIVLRLTAADDEETGKVKIKLGNKD